MTDKKNGWIFGTRHFQILLIAICMFGIKSLYGCSNMAVLAMTDKNQVNVTVYDWDKKIIGYIFSCSYFGDMVVQCLIAPLIYKYGGKLFICIALGGCALNQFITPYLVNWGDWKGMCVSNTLTGFFAGFFNPSMQNLLGKWAPDGERTRMGISIYLGLYMAYIVALPLSGYISSLSYGWKGLYYFFGFQTLCICVLWRFFGSNSPSDHKYISKTERELIHSSLGDINSEMLKTVPWKSILTCKAYYALILIEVSIFWGFYIITTEIPTYFKLAVGTKLQESGLFSSFGYILAIIFSVCSSWIFDYLLTRKYFSLSQLRKTFNLIGTFGPAICFVIITFIPIQYVLIIFFLTTITTALEAINTCGYAMNYVDLSSSYCSVLCGVSAIISDFFCILAPIINGYILDDITDVTKWRKVFMLSAGLYFVANLIFLIFGETKKQSWDCGIKDKPKEDNVSQKVAVIS